jgi:hypothetical protein
VVTERADHRHVDSGDTGHWRGVVDNAALETSHVGLRAFDLDENTAGVVADMAPQCKLRSQAVDERPEADTLDHTCHA